MQWVNEWEFAFKWARFGLINSFCLFFFVLFFCSVHVVLLRSLCPFIIVYIYVRKFLCHIVYIFIYKWQHNEAAATTAAAAYFAVALFYFNLFYFCLFLVLLLLFCFHFISCPCLEWYTHSLTHSHKDVTSKIVIFTVFSRPLIHKIQIHTWCLPNEHTKCVCVCTAKRMSPAASWRNGLWHR